MNLTCPNCHRPLHPDDVDLKTSIGSCVDCARVFHIYDQIREATDDVEGRSRPEQAKPKRVDISSTGGAMDLCIRWYSPAGFIFVLFAVPWFGFLVFWYAMTFAMPDDSPVWLFRIFPLIHVAAGSFVLWKGLTALLNKTRIRCTDDELVVTHGPIPAGKAQRYKRAELAQFFTIEKIGSKGARTYNLQLRTDKRAVVVVLKDLAALEEPLFVEQQLERFYGIRDRAEPGEAKLT